MKPSSITSTLYLLLAFSWGVSAVKIGMKPIREPDAQSLSQINGFYFEPIGSSNYVCHKNTIPRDCNGTIAVDLSKDSSLTIEWVASEVEAIEKYISLRASGENTVKFEFYAQYQCDNDAQYQDVNGEDISYSFDYLPDSGVGELTYIPSTSFMEIGKFGTSCFIYSKMEFGVGSSGELKLDISKATFTANYDKSKVPQGSRDYTVSTSKFNWINFGNVASSSVEFSLVNMALYPSASPTGSPTAAPTRSTSPTAVPSFTPAPTTSTKPTSNVTEKRQTTSGSDNIMLHYWMHVVGITMALFFTF